MVVAAHRGCSGPPGGGGDGFRWEVGMEEGKDAEKVGLLVSLLTCS